MTREEWVQQVQAVIDATDATEELSDSLDVRGTSLIEAEGLNWMESIDALLKQDRDADIMDTALWFCIEDNHWRPNTKHLLRRLFRLDEFHS